MALVSKKESGFIYSDDFSKGINSNWELSPNTPSRAVYDGSKLNLKHGTTPIYLFLKALNNVNEFVLDLRNQYNPTIDGDVGGITAYANKDDQIALEEYFNVDAGTVESFPWIRLVRDYATYSAYWSNDGTEWNPIGTSTLNSNTPKVGLFLEGKTGSDLGIEFVRAMKSDKLRVDNLQAGTVVSLVDRTGNKLDSLVCREQDNKVVFDVSGLPVPFEAKFVIDTGVHVLDFDRFYKIYGGDVYAFEVTPDLIFVKDGEEYYLDSSVEEFIGYITQDNTHNDAHVIIRNPLTGTFKNIMITLAQHHNTDHWNRLISIAKESATPTWGVQVVYSELLSGTSEKMLARLKKEYDPTKYTPSVYFGLKVTATYSLT